MFPKASKTTTKHLPPSADKLTPEGKPIGVAPTEKIEPVFPGFPLKSPGKERVLGPLPDFAELLLRRLEMLALAVQDYHLPVL